MTDYKTLKSISIEGLSPTITLTPVIEPCGEGYRIHHIKSDSIARDGRDTFVPLRHMSKQRRRIFELEEENAKLRSELESVGTAAYLYGRDQLKAENDKLRELVRIMYYCNLPQKDCDKCVMNGADMEVQVSDIEFCDGLNERMRELGIEVNE